MKIRIFQRHCNFSTQSAHKPRPTWFNREKIFDLFISTLDERVDYTAFHDSGNGSIEEHFLQNKNVNKVSVLGGNDAQSFLNVLNYVVEQKYDDNDIIYFLEDDYLHKAGWIDIMLEGFEYIGDETCDTSTGCWGNSETLSDPTLQFLSFSISVESVLHN